MLSIRLIKLIETHADALTREVVDDLLTNEHTPAFHRIPAGDLAPRVLRLYQHLGNWLAILTTTPFVPNTKIGAGFAPVRAFPSAKWFIP
jgi:hypothetical protein